MFLLSKMVGSENPPQLAAVRRQLLWLGQIVCVLQRLLFKPLEAVQLELALPYLRYLEAAPAVLFRVPWLPLTLAVGVRAVALLELGEVGWRQGAVLLGD